MHPWTSQSRGLQAQLTHLQTGFFLHFLLKLKNNNKITIKKTGEGTSIRRSKVTLLFSFTRVSVDFFMLSSHIWPAFLALIPPSFTSLNLFETFFRPLQPRSSSHNWESMRIPGLTPTLPVICRKCSHAKPCT